MHWAPPNFPNISLKWSGSFAGENSNVHATVQKFTYCTCRPDVSQCPAVQRAMDYTSRKRPSTAMTHIACELKIRAVTMSSMPRKQGGNRECGRVLCRDAQGFSAGIKWRHCTCIPYRFELRISSF